MTKSFPIRVLPFTKFLFIPHKSLPYCYVKWDVKVSKKVIKILSNKMNQFPYCSPHFNNNKQKNNISCGLAQIKIFSSSFIFQVLQMLLDFQFILHIKHTNKRNYQQLQDVKFARWPLL